MVNEQYERAKRILSEHKEGHNKLAQLLIEKEVIFAEDVERIFGKRPWTSRSEEIFTANRTSAELKAAEEQQARRALEAERKVKSEEEQNTSDDRPGDKPEAAPKGQEPSEETSKKEEA